MSGVSCHLHSKHESAGTFQGVYMIKIKFPRSNQKQGAVTLGTFCHVTHVDHRHRAVSTGLSSFLQK